MKKPKFKQKVGGRPAVSGASFGSLMKSSKSTAPAKIQKSAPKPMPVTTAPKAAAPKPSGTNKGPSAKAFANANANASFKRAPGANPGMMMAPKLKQSGFQGKAERAIGIKSTKPVKKPLY